MARTKGIPKPAQVEKYVRTIEYRGYTIAKLLDGSLRVLYPKSVYPNEPFMPVGSLTEGKEHVDKVLAQFDAESAESVHTSTSTASKSRVTDDPRKRGRRTKGVKRIDANTYCYCDPEKYAHVQHGGYIMNPPEECQHRVRWEGEKPWFVGAITCHGTCKLSEKCDFFKEFMKGQRERIKLMNSERSDEKCPYCMTARVLEEKNGNAEYSCGTTYNRLEGQYTQACKKKSKKKEQEAPTPKKRRRTK